MSGPIKKFKKLVKLKRLFFVHVIFTIFLPLNLKLFSFNISAASNAPFDGTFKPEKNVITIAGSSKTSTKLTASRNEG